MKYFLSSLLLFFISSAAAFAGELTPGNLVGRYKIEARAGLQKKSM